ncbi:Ig-like domain-containing protein [Rubrivirga sp.]|uniref:Ig-like domain-containing protein n=1 Tax=Rubrivirga sp. TaxID=1885344 RepID=UPI003B52EDC6
MQRFYSLVAMLAISLALAPMASAQRAVPGTVPSGYSGPITPSNALDPVITETGLISASIDGCGTTAPTCITDVEKPAGATVRRAYLAASTSFSATIPDGGITINGAPVTWDDTDSGLGGFFNTYGSDVTAIVQPIVDAAPAGTVALTIGESNTSRIDGSSLVVVFDDPSVTTGSTVVIAFGAQDTGGDTFNITLGGPFDDATQDITMSLAIGFSFQDAADQFSIIDVNGERLTSSAGGDDDAVNVNPANGALYTVGGLGDDPANPADPDGGPEGDPRTDDELYTLDPFIDEGDTQIVVFSSNPSDDDIIHLATFIIEGASAIIGEGILLTPPAATNPVGTDHTVTAFIQDDNGDPVSGRDVDFEVLSGPNAGLMGSDVTNADGNAFFTFSSDVAGTDVVVARFEDSEGQTITSNQVTKTWEESDEDTEAPVCGGITIDPTGPGRVLTSATDNVGIVRASFLRATNLDGFINGAGPFSQGDVYDLPAPAMSVDIEGVRKNTSNPRATLVVRVFDAAGNSAKCDPVLDQLASASDVTSLGQSQPNPTAGPTSIPFSLAEPGPVRLAVYDVLGREVAVIVDQDLGPGSYELSWDGTDALGRALSPGTYVYRLNAGTFSAVQQLTLVR